MNVSQLEWIVTVGVAIAVLLFDVAYIGRRPHNRAPGNARST